MPGSNSPSRNNVWKDSFGRIVPRNLWSCSLACWSALLVAHLSRCQGNYIQHISCSGLLFLKLTQREENLKNVFCCRKSTWRLEICKRSCSSIAENCLIKWLRIVQAGLNLYLGEGSLHLLTDQSQSTCGFLHKQPTDKNQLFNFLLQA